MITEACIYGESVVLWEKWDLICFIRKQNHTFVDGYPFINSKDDTDILKLGPCHGLRGMFDSITSTKEVIECCSLFQRICEQDL